MPQSGGAVVEEGPVSANGPHAEVRIRVVQLLNDEGGTAV